MAINRIVFLTYGDEGRTNWRCLNCGHTCDAGHPSHREYRFCPHCGTQWESEQPNARIARDERYYDAGRYPYEFKQFDCLADMKKQYQDLKRTLAVRRLEMMDRSKQQHRASR